MPQKIIQFSQTTEGIWALGVLLALVGLTFWLGGARFNRAFSTLAGVLIGGVVGMQLPQWAGWSISGMGPAVAGAMGVGLAGFLLYRAWIGPALGILLAIAVVLVTAHICGWQIFSSSSASSANAAGNEGYAMKHLTDLWHSMPGGLMYTLPAIAAAALFAGLTIGILWPALATVILYSLSGVSILAGLFAALDGGVITRPHWLAGHLATQAAIFLVMVLAGVALQWRQVRRSAAPAASSLQDEWEEDL